MKLTPIEQETILLYNQAEDTAEVYTHDRKLMEKLTRLSQKHPEQVCGKIPGPDREKGPSDLYGAQTLRIGAGAVQRRAPQGCQ